MAGRSTTLEAVSSWDELRAILGELMTADPPPLRTFPGPDAVDMVPPFRIALAPWALDVAQRLHAQFGDDVQLTVGYLRYPSRELPDHRGRDPAPASAAGVPLLQEREAEVATRRSLTVRSGYDLHSELLVTNRGPAPLVVESTGTIFGRVLDPATGDVVGGYAGQHPLPLVRSTASPGETITVPLVVGTASFRRSLGYAVPPGAWAVEVVLHLGTDQWRRAPLLPLRVTA